MRQALAAYSVADLIAMTRRAAPIFLNDTLPLGDASQSPDDYVMQLSATTGMPHVMVRRNMKRVAAVMENVGFIFRGLTRGLDPEVLDRGFADMIGQLISFSPRAKALGVVLPSNSPGVHTLWLPIIPLQVGLVLKPGPQEPWTPYRMAEAFFQAGIPREALSLYPGGADVGAAVLDALDRTMIFGGQATVDRYRGNPKVQAHGPGFSKIVLGDDLVDRWEDFLDMMVDSVFLNSGRGCINCSGIWASRHTQEIADAIAKRLARIEALPPDHPEASLAAFTVPGVADAISAAIDADVQAPGVTEVTAKYRDGRPRLVKQGRAEYLLPTVLHCDSPEAAAAKKEYMFPFTTVVQCPEAKMIEAMGPTLVCTALTNNEALRRKLLDAVHVDRLNFGPVPTTQLNWLQPHEGNLIDFLFRARAFQTAAI